LTPAFAEATAIGASATCGAGVGSGFGAAGRSDAAGLLAANDGDEGARGEEAGGDDATLVAVRSRLCGAGVLLTTVASSVEELACPKRRGGSRRIEAATTSAAAAAPVATRIVRFDRCNGMIPRSDRTSLTIFVFTGLA
jgi:hypothetical protein